MANHEIAIKVNGVGKTFQPQSSSKTIKEAFINLGRKISGKKELKHHKGEYTALKDVSFEVKKGEFFGIVGRNGCGKSTLLKILAGVYTPTKGSVQVNGKLTPFIELGVGFNPELSGRDNVFLNGALLGFSRSQMEAMYDDIVDFAELHDFMDTKLKNYSSGMQVRLAFSVAIRAESDILLIDEVLAVGDQAFQQKCYDYFYKLKKQNKTVVLVTHDMGSMELFCDQAILIDEGVIIKSNTSSLVARGYESLFNIPQNETQIDEIVEDIPENRWGNGKIKFHDISYIINDEIIKINIIVECEEDVQGKFVLAYTIKSNDGRSLFGDGVAINSVSALKKGSKTNLELSFNNILASGKYDLDLSIRNEYEKGYLDFWIDCACFEINSKKNDLNILTNSKVKVKR